MFAQQLTDDEGPRDPGRAPYDQQRWAWGVSRAVAVGGRLSATKAVRPTSMRMYRLTARGRKQLTIEQSRWDAVVRAMARVLKPV